MVRHGVALFGHGRAGSIHFLNILKHWRLHLVYLIDIEVDRCQQLVEQYSLTDTTVLHPDSANVVYEDSRVQGVVVCTPTYSHENIVLMALKHGKAVFCEKPISEDLEGVKACYRQAKAAGLPLLCSFNRRFDPSIRSLRDKVLAGAVGDVHSIKTTARDHPFPPLEYLKISGGLFHDCGVHDIDVVCWIAGEWPETVYAQGTAFRKEIQDMKDVDTVAIVMKFPSGILATIDLSRNASYGYDQRFEVFGTTGMLQVENQKGLSLKCSFSHGAVEDPLKHSFPQRYAHSYEGALEHFVALLDGTEELEIESSDTINICRVASACEQSFQTGLPVHLQLNGMGSCDKSDHGKHIIPSQVEVELQDAAVA